MPHNKNYENNKRSASGHPNKKIIVSDGSIAGKKVKTPRTRRPVPKKHDPK